jgi:hypothetical protein
MNAEKTESMIMEGGEINQPPTMVRICLSSQSKRNWKNMEREGPRKTQL